MNAYVVGFQGCTVLRVLRLHKKTHSRSCEDCHNHAGQTQDLTTCIDVARKHYNAAMLCFAAHLYVTYVPPSSQANTMNSFQGLFYKTTTLTMLQRLAEKMHMHMIVTGGLIATIRQVSGTSTFLLDKHQSPVMCQMCRIRIIP